MAKTILGLVPYFGGTSVATRSSIDNRLPYLKKTLDSMAKYCDQIIVGVCNEEDRELTDGLLLECAPEYIPSNLCRYAQKNIKADYYYCSEADQVIHLKKSLIKDVIGGDYLVPHRIEQLGQYNEGDTRGMLVEYKGKTWVLANGIPFGNRLYHPENPIDQFGGAFLCTRELFKTVNFIDAGQMHVEHATGLDIADAGYTLKTSDWRGFFVEHLSGYEYHEHLGGR